MKADKERYAKAASDYNKAMKALQDEYAVIIKAEPLVVARDEGSFLDRVKAMGMELTPQQHGHYLGLQQDCITKASEVELAPNNNQYGCAVYIAEKLKPTANEKRLLLSMGPGEGKSRITVGLLYLMCKKGVTSFTLLFSHEALMKADKVGLERLQKQWCLDIRYEVFS